MQRSHAYGFVSHGLILRSGITGPYICMLYIYIYHIIYNKHLKKMPSHFTLLHSHQLSSFFISSPRLVTVCLSNYSHPSGCTAVSHYGTAGPLYLLVLYLWVQTDDCTMTFYIRTWASLDFGIRRRSGTNPPWIQRDDCIDLHFPNC